MTDELLFTSFPLNIRKGRPHPLFDVAEDDWSNGGRWPHPPVENQIYYTATGDQLLVAASQGHLGTNRK